MLKKLTNSTEAGREVFLVTREGEILDGFRVVSVLGDLVSLDDPEMKGFTLAGDRLKPNWCEGRKMLIGGFFNRKEAEEMARRKQG